MYPLVSRHLKMEIVEGVGEIPFLVFALKRGATRWQEYPASSWQLGCAVVVNFGEILSHI